MHVNMPGVRDAPCVLNGSGRNIAPDNREIGSSLSLTRWKPHSSSDSHDGTPRSGVNSPTSSKKFSKRSKSWGRARPHSPVTRSARPRSRHGVRSIGTHESHVLTSLLDFMDASCPMKVLSPYKPLFWEFQSMKKHMKQKKHKQHQTSTYFLLSFPLSLSAGSEPL